MMKKKNSKFSFTFLVLIISAQILLTQVINASGVNSIQDKIGGGSNDQTSAQSDSGNSSTIYVVGALVVGGLLFYKFVLDKKDKKDKKKEEKSEDEKKAAFLNSPDEDSNALPFNINLSLQKIMPNVESRSVVVGVSLPF